MTWEG